MCGSGQQAIQFAGQAIASGDMDLVIACGVELMSVVQMGSDAEKEVFSSGKVGFAPFPYKLLHQGQSAELLAEKYQISRKELDEFAANSHKKAAEAIKKGYFSSQIMPVKVAKKKQDGTVEEKWFLNDEGVRYPVGM